MNKIKTWWGGLGRKAKIIVAGVAVFFGLGVIGSLAGPPATEPVANVAPSASVAPSSVVASGTASAVDASPTPTASTEVTPEPTPEVTVEPTAEPTPEATAEPTPAPVAAKPVLKVAGRGDKIVKMTAQDVPTYVKITGKGSGNFAVVSYQGSTYDDLLVNEIGSYSGSVYVAPGVDRFEVTSSGSWTIEAKPVTSAKHWSGTTALTGKGDAVINLNGGSSGIVTIKNKSKDNFAVTAYTQDGEYLDLLVNEIGSYNGEVMLPDSDPMVLVIDAVGGAWSVSSVSQ